MEELVKPVVAGNWKMYKTISEARELTAEIVNQSADLSGASLILIPPFTAIQEVKKRLEVAALKLEGRIFSGKRKELLPVKFLPAS